MGNNSEQPHSLAEDVKLSAHERHPTAYPFYFLFIFSFIFIWFLFSTVTLLFCFSGTSVLEFKFGGECFESYLFQPVSSSPR
jgi:hypothetical protein